ncbi:hypothetical protein BZG36_02168 [Bifiguratus adelaidae]|uniref:Uncharacterized protein n=1 Tax=Bifiguratus adelaidae TaxID=1938954 RepID=A0A261Y0P0_9FUNG|nr:hypothetical protein BZG36_02168 [Bifiguratus adelaidae]
MLEVPYFPPGWPQDVHLASFIQPISYIPDQQIHCFLCNTITPYGLFDGFTCISYDQNGVCLGSTTNRTSSDGGNIDSDFANAIYANFTAYSNVCQLIWMTVSYKKSELGCRQTVNNVTHCVAFEKVVTNGAVSDAVSDFPAIKTSGTANTANIDQICIYGRRSGTDAN